MFLLSRQRAAQRVAALQRAVQRDKATQHNAVVEMLFNCSEYFLICKAPNKKARE